MSAILDIVFISFVLCESFPFLIALFFLGACFGLVCRGLFVRLCAPVTFGLALIVASFVAAFRARLRCFFLAEMRGGAGMRMAFRESIAGVAWRVLDGRSGVGRLFVSVWPSGVRYVAGGGVASGACRWARVVWLGSRIVCGSSVFVAGVRFGRGVLRYAQGEGLNFGAAVGRWPFFRRLGVGVDAPARSVDIVSQSPVGLVAPGSDPERPWAVEIGAMVHDGSVIPLRAESRNGVPLDVDLRISWVSELFGVDLYGHHARAAVAVTTPSSTASWIRSYKGLHAMRGDAMIRAWIIEVSVGEAGITPGAVSARLGAMASNANMHKALRGTSFYRELVSVRPGPGVPVWSDKSAGTAYEALLSVAWECTEDGGEKSELACGVMHQLAAACGLVLSACTCSE